MLKTTVCFFLLVLTTPVFAQFTDQDAEYGRAAHNLIVLSERLRVTERYVFFAQQKVLDARAAMIELLYEGQPSIMTSVWMEVIASASDEITLCENDITGIVKPALQAIAARLESEMYRNAVASHVEPLDDLIENLHRGRAQLRATTLRLHQFVSGDNIMGVMEQMHQLRTVSFVFDGVREQLNSIQNELRRLARQLREISPGH